MTDPTELLITAALGMIAGLWVAIWQSRPKP